MHNELKEKCYAKFEKIDDYPVVAALMIGVIFLVTATTAYATETDVVYVNAAGEDMGTEKCELVNSEVTTWSEGWYAMKFGVIIWGQSESKGWLRIYGKTDYHAGIGGEPDSSETGSLTINGGRITIQGGKGTCYIYTFAHNGVCKQTRVTAR